MGNKGGVSFPMVLVVTILIVVIVIALVYLFVFNTKEQLEIAFEDLTKSISSFGCNSMGALSNFVCPGG